MPGTSRVAARDSSSASTRRSCARSAICSRSRRPSPSTTRNVDDEIARIAGPQLVVPVSNARYALNAANARWGSLYDALYGTDAIPETDGATRGRRLQPGARRARSSRMAKRILDEAAPLAAGSHAEATATLSQDGALAGRRSSDGGRSAGRSGAIRRLSRRRGRARRRSCCATTACTSRSDRPRPPDRPRPIRPASPTWCSKAAVTTIMDCEDSVAAVDAEDKVARLPQLARA